MADRSYTNRRLETPPTFLLAMEEMLGEKWAVNAPVEVTEISCRALGDPAYRYHIRIRRMRENYCERATLHRQSGGIVIPPGVTQVRVRAHDLVDGYSRREVLVDLTVSSGPDFEVER
jgi:hypothetical protein